MLTTLLARGAICVTVSSSRFATQMYPAPAATSAGRTPVGIVSTSRLDSGSITASELPVARSGSDASSPAAKIAATAAASRIAPPARDQDGAAAGPSRRGRRPAAGRRVDRRVLPEDRLLEGLELAARLEPELVGERTARVLVARERIRLTARAVEGEHELGAQPLARGVLADERLELGDQGRVAAERQIGLDALLERQQPELVEPGDLGLRELLVGEVRERRAAPHVERLAGGGRERRSRVAALERARDRRRARRSKRAASSWSGSMSST